MKRAVLGLTVCACLACFCGTAVALNQVAFEPTVAGYCGAVNVRVYIENDVDVQSITLPLVARSVTPGVFWRDSVVMLPPTGRLATSLTDFQTLSKGEVDFTSPDQFLLHFESLTPGVACLPTGPLQHMITLNAGVLGVGTLEIDTMSSPPCVTPQLLRCGDYAAIALDAFAKGTIELLPDGFVLIDFQDDSVTGTAGDLLQNQTIAVDPEGDPLGYYLQSGPGEVNPNTGAWSWATCPRDSGAYTVEIEVYQKGCGPNTGPAGTFPVRVLPHDPADLNCDGVADAVDLAISIDHIFFGQNIPPCD